MKKRIFQVLFLAAFACLLFFALPTTAQAEERYCYECEDMSMFCEYCGEKCVACNTGCDNCWSCDECLALCSVCEDVCVVCNIGCDNCWTCEDCLQLCTVCEDVCAVCEVGCDTCWICEECIKVCQNCDACLECAGDGCGNGCEQLCEDCCSENDARCVICHECVLCSSIKCEECGFCIECAPECQMCDECLECAGDGCANDCGQICESCVGDNEGACPECGQCFLCVNWKCDSCYMCEDCMTEEYACSICEECIECYASGKCENCNACWNCVPICTSCENACTECSTLCSDCEEYCEDCAVICESCGVCENCAQLCEDCGLCENCVTLCDSCGVCEECVVLCAGCEEICEDCASDWCGECGSCDDCVQICENCYSICEECADTFCSMCYNCSDCEEICTGCEEICKGCAFEWCNECGSCGDCAIVCAECGLMCKDCVDDWCINCDSCSDCTDFCPDCNDCVRCCMCDGGIGGGDDEDGEHVHSVTKVDGYDATCTEAGQHTYYVCECGKWFENASATREITSKKAIIIPAGHYFGKLIEQLDPVHSADRLEAGMKPHYICRDCGTYFTANQKETDMDSLKIPETTHTYSGSWTYKGPDGHGKACSCGAIEEIKPHTPGKAATETKPQLCQDCGYVIAPPKNHSHKLTKVLGKEPTCTEKGQKEHYTCDCGKWFEDAEGKKEITLLTSLTLPAAHHYSPLILEKPAVHTPEGEIQPGMKAHYECEGCEKIFNANKQEKTAESLAVNKVAHRFYDENEDGKCDDCVVILQDYEEQIKEEQKEPEDQNPEPEQKAPVKKADKSKGIPWWAVALMAVFCGAIGVLAALLILKKLKQNKA